MILGAVRPRPNKCAYGDNRCARRGRALGLRPHPRRKGRILEGEVVGADGRASLPAQVAERWRRSIGWTALALRPNAERWRSRRTCFAIMGGRAMAQHEDWVSNRGGRASGRGGV